MAERKIINVRDFPELEKKMADYFKKGGIVGNASQFEGPGTGLDFNPDTGKIRIANGFHADENGNVVPD